MRPSIPCYRLPCGVRRIPAWPIAPALPTPIHELTGNDPQTEQSEFTVPDAWELRWTSPRLINISVLGADGTPVVGTAGISGVIYVAKGGTFHLQVDCHRKLADLLPRRNPDGTTRNWIPPEETSAHVPPLRRFFRSCCKVPRLS